MADEDERCILSGEMLLAYLRSRWLRMFPEDDPDPEVGAVFDRLIQNYAEPHRRYHTAEHLYACFRVLDEFFPEASMPVQLALWFHDIVYDPHSNENEEKSGEIALEELGRIDLEPFNVYDLILATKHNEPPQGSEAKIVVDVDLSILGETPEAYHQYEQQVRQEYGWVPEEVFWAYRRSMLRQFMDHEWIFHTEVMRRSIFEERAWINLAASVGSGAAIGPRT